MVFDTNNSSVEINEWLIGTVACDLVCPKNEGKLIDELISWNVQVIGYAI